jgi:hypothetical protein
VAGGCPSTTRAVRASVTLASINDSTPLPGAAISARLERGADVGRDGGGGPPGSSAETSRRPRYSTLIWTSKRLLTIASTSAKMRTP